MQSAEGPHMNGIPLRGWKTDVHRGEERTAGFNLTGYKTASTSAKLFERESLHPCDPGRKTRSNVSGAGGGEGGMEVAQALCIFLS